MLHGPELVVPLDKIASIPGLVEAVREVESIRSTSGRPGDPDGSAFSVSVAATMNKTVIGRDDGAEELDDLARMEQMLIRAMRSPRVQRAMREAAG